MTCQDPSCPPQEPSKLDGLLWDENNLVQRCSDFPAVIFAPDDISLPCSAVPGTPGTDVEVNVTVPVDMLWTSSQARRTGNFLETIAPQWERGASLDNGPVRDYLFWGQPGQPSRHSPKFLPRQKKLKIVLNDISGAGLGLFNTVKLAFCGFQIPEAMLEAYAKMFGQGRGLMRLSNQKAGDIIPASSPAAPYIQVPDDYHFRHDTTCSDATSVEWEGQYTYRDARLTREQSNANKRIHSSLWTGCVKGNAPATGLPGAPFVLASPELLQGGSTVAFDLQDKSGAPNTWFILFTGARVEKCSPTGIASKCAP